MREDFKHGGRRMNTEIFGLLVSIALRAGSGRFGNGKINPEKHNKLLRSSPLSVKHI